MSLTVVVSFGPTRGSAPTDAARVTSAQVYELVRYAQQSNPVVLHQALAVLQRDATTMAALGASIAAILIQHRANRNASRTPADRMHNAPVIRASRARTIVASRSAANASSAK